MIQASVMGVVQRMNFATQTIDNYALISLLGESIEVPLTLQQLQTLVQDGMQSLQEGPQPTPAPPPQAVQAPPQPDYEETTHWPSLPDTVLDPRVKAALHMLQVPQTLVASDLQRLVQNVVEEFTEQDWSEVSSMLATSEQAPAPVPAPAPAPQQPPLNTITWNDGTPILPQQAQRARTVQKDDYGYPIVSSSDVDPTSVMSGGDDGDEDGIGQM